MSYSETREREKRNTDVWWGDPTIRVSITWSLCGRIIGIQWMRMRLLVLDAQLRWILQGNPRECRKASLCMYIFIYLYMISNNSRKGRRILCVLTVLLPWHLQWPRKCTESFFPIVLRSLYRRPPIRASQLSLRAKILSYTVNSPLSLYNYYTDLSRNKRMLPQPRSVAYLSRWESFFRLPCIAVFIHRYTSGPN